MINSVNYLPRWGNLEIREGKHRRVIQSLKTVEGVTFPDSDVSKESLFIQTLFNSVKGLLPDSAVKSCRFNLEIGTIRVDSRKLTPDDDLTNEVLEVRTFAGVVFTPENRVIYEANKPPVPVEFEEEDEEFEDFKFENGKHIVFTNTRQKIKTRPEPLFNEDGTRAMKNGQPRFITVKVEKG